MLATQTPAQNLSLRHIYAGFCHRQPGIRRQLHSSNVLWTNGKRNYAKIQNWPEPRRQLSGCDSLRSYRPNALWDSMYAGYQLCSSMWRCQSCFLFQRYHALQLSLYLPVFNFPAQRHYWYRAEIWKRGIRAGFLRSIRTCYALIFLKRTKWASPLQLPIPSIFEEHAPLLRAAAIPLRDKLPYCGVRILSGAFFVTGKCFYALAWQNLSCYKNKRLPWQPLIFPKNFF